MYRRILQILFPELCRVCQKITRPEKYLCDVCDQQIKKIEEPCCSLCGLPYPSDVGISHPCGECLSNRPSFDWHRSAVLYKDPVKKMIREFKYRQVEGLLPLFSSWLLEKGGGFLKDFDYLVPVPLSMKRLRKRGYNQSLELAKILSRKTGIPCLPHSLQKVRETPPQTELTQKERVTNLKNAFEWKDNRIDLKEKNILLIDDVYTTGSTLKTCAEVLSQRGASFIGAVTIAMSPP